MKTWMEVGLALVVVGAWLGVSLVADGALKPAQPQAQTEAPAAAQATPAQAPRQPA